MKIRTTTLQASPSGVIDIGTEIDLPDEEAAHLILHGAAVPVVSDDIETATLPPAPERAARTTKPKGR